MINWTEIATPPRPIPGAMSRLAKTMSDPRNVMELRYCLCNLDSWDHAYFGYPEDRLDHRTRQSDLFGGYHND